MNEKKIKYSVIIPTLNEAQFIRKLLPQIDNQREKKQYHVEIIISDGNSSDNTIEICKNYNVATIKSEKGRGEQLRSGAKSSKGEILIFLHADLKIPDDMFGYLDEYFKDQIKIATFRMNLNVNKTLYKFYSFFTRYDSIFTTFGDQGIIVRRNFYTRIGGFNKMPLMEDVDFLKRARSLTKIVKFKNNVIVSTRRFEKVGIVKTQLKSFVCIIKYLMGIDPDKIYKYYYLNKDEKKKSGYCFRKISRKRKSKNQISFINK